MDPDHQESHLKWLESWSFDLVTLKCIKNALRNGMTLGVLDFGMYVKRLYENCWNNNFLNVAVFDTFKGFIHKFFTIRDSRGQGKIDYVDLGHLFWAKNWNITLGKQTFSSFLVEKFSIFCLDELAQINIIYLWPTPRVPVGEKFMDKALKSIKYSLF